MDAKRTVEQIVEASKDGAVKYEVVNFRGVKVLMTATKIRDAITVTHEFTHDPDVEKLAKEMGITLRRFR